MPEENVEIMRRAYAALAEGGVEAILPFTHPEFEVETPPSLASEPGTYRGHSGVRRYFQSFGDGLEDVYFEGREFTPAGDHVIVATSLHARGRTTGIDVKQDAFVVWTLRDGLVIKSQAFPERGPALEAAGLSE
jgi:ketosteroid isomerase-like protein